jgi:hypothetical protein
MSTVPTKRSAVAMASGSRFSAKAGTSIRIVAAARSTSIVAAGRITLIAAAVVVGLAIGTPADAQSPVSAQPQDARSEVVRGLTGSWDRHPNRFGVLEPDPDAPPGPAPIPDPPLKAEYAATWRAEQQRIAELTEEGLPPANNYSACVPDGMPAMMQAMFPMEVLETPGQITIIQEAYNQVRRIYLGEQALAPEEAEPRFAGHSVGRWEGDTLVVETVGVKDYVEFRNVPHSANMRVVERLRLVDDDYMENQVTVIDPEYLTEPWTWTWMYRRWPGYKIHEYVCEDNRYYADPERGYQRLRIE